MTSNDAYGRHNVHYLKSAISDYMILAGLKMTDIYFKMVMEGQKVLILECCFNTKPKKKRKK